MDTVDTVDTLDMAMATAMVDMVKVTLLTPRLPFLPLFLLPFLPLFLFPFQSQPLLTVERCTVARCPESLAVKVLARCTAVGGIKTRTAHVNHRRGWLRLV